MNTGDIAAPTKLNWIPEVSENLICILYNSLNFCLYFFFKSVWSISVSNVLPANFLLFVQLLNNEFKTLYTQTLNWKVKFFLKPETIK